MGEARSTHGINGNCI